MPAVALADRYAPALVCLTVAAAIVAIIVSVQLATKYFRPDRRHRWRTVVFFSAFAAFLLAAVPFVADRWWTLLLDVAVTATLILTTVGCARDWPGFLPDDAQDESGCPYCGYDLRATPDPDGPLLDRCPECGHLIDPTPGQPDPH